jgi:hypothetical protein
MSMRVKRPETLSMAAINVENDVVGLSAGYQSIFSAPSSSIPLGLHHLQYSIPEAVCLEDRHESYNIPTALGTAYSDDSDDAPAKLGTAYSDDSEDEPAALGTAYSDDSEDEPAALGTAYSDDSEDEPAALGTAYSDDSEDEPAELGTPYHDDCEDEPIALGTKLHSRSDIARYTVNKRKMNPLNNRKKQDRMMWDMIGKIIESRFLIVSNGELVLDNKKVLQLVQKYLPKLTPEDRRHAWLAKPGATSPNVEGSLGPEQGWVPGNNFGIKAERRNIHHIYWKRGDYKTIGKWVQKVKHMVQGVVPEGRVFNVKDVMEKYQGLINDELDKHRSVQAHTLSLREEIRQLFKRTDTPAYDDSKSTCYQLVDRLLNSGAFKDSFGKIIVYYLMASDCIDDFSEAVYKWEQDNAGFAIPKDVAGIVPRGKAARGEEHTKRDTPYTVYVVPRQLFRMMNKKESAASSKKLKKEAHRRELSIVELTDKEKKAALRLAAEKKIPVSGGDFETYDDWRNAHFMNQVVQLENTTHEIPQRPQRVGGPDPFRLEPPLRRRGRANSLGEEYCTCTDIPTSEEYCTCEDIPTSEEYCPMQTSAQFCTCDDY